MLRLTGAIVLAASLTACAGTAQAHHAKPTFNVNGQVIAEQDPVGSIQTRHCLPEDSGLRKGAQVVVTDEKGTTLGVDRLVGGSADGKLGRGGRASVLRGEGELGRGPVLLVAGARLRDDPALDKALHPRTHLAGGPGDQRAGAVKVRDSVGCLWDDPSVASDYERADLLRKQLRRRGLVQEVLVTLERMTPSDCLIHGGRIMAMDDAGLRRLNAFGRTSALARAKALLGEG